MTDSVERRSNPWVVLVALLAVSVFNFADRYLLTGLVNPIKAEFNLGDGFMGLLMGPAFVALYVLTGVPIARLADRASRVRIIAVGCIFWSIATMASGFAIGPVTLALARIGVGIGEACFAAPAYSLLTQYFKPERRGIAFAILGLATYIGQILGQAGGPAIAHAAGWRHAFIFMGIPGILLGLLALALIREPDRETIKSGAAALPFAALVGKLATSPALVLLVAAMGLGTLSGVAFGSWGPELFARSYDLEPEKAKATFALPFALAGMIGMLIFGGVCDRLFKRRQDGPILLTAFALFSATACILAVTWSPNIGLAAGLAIPSGLLGGGWSVGVMATLQYILPERFRAAATALFLAVVTLFGYMLGPWIAGLVSQAGGDNAQSLRVGLSVVIPFGFAGALCALLAARKIEADRARLAQA